MGIADQEEFWVRIKRVVDDKVDDYDVVEVRTVNEIMNSENKEIIGSRNMRELYKLRDELNEYDEYITMIKSVEIRIMQIQKKEEIGTPRNRRCVVNRRTYSC